MKKFSIVILTFSLVTIAYGQKQEIQIVEELFRLRNEHKADSAELLYADTVQVYMKYLRNIPRPKITAADKAFWKSHPRNKFEITEPIRIKTENGLSTATIKGKEYLDGSSYKKERIEIRFDANKKIISFRGYKDR